MTQINERDPIIAAYLDQWQRNRDMVEGERVVKRAGEKYLPRRSLDDTQFEMLVQLTTFYPGAARTHEGLMGLITHKPATLVVPDKFKDVLATISSDGTTIDDLALRASSEFTITNYVGLLTDHPQSNGVVSEADAIARGIRPQISLYTAESFLAPPETAIINNRRRVVRVRLQENDETIRELRLDNGVYSMTVHKLVNGEWIANEPIIPTRNGKPLDEIPFTCLMTDPNLRPSKAKIADVCDVNAQHYIASSTLALADYFSTNPVPYVFGTKISKLALGMGTFLTSESKGQDVRVGYLEYSGTALSQLQARVDMHENHMGKVGMRILAQEKAAAEASETTAIRNAAEDSILAATARVVTRAMNDQLKWVSWWLGLDEGTITYTLNTNYQTTRLTSQDRAQIQSEWQSGLYSKDAALDQLIAGDILPETFDRELDAQKIAEETVDRPPVDAPAPDQTSPPSA